MEPIRKIVVLQPHEWLFSGFAGRSFSASAPELDRMILSQGMRFDERVPPARVPDFGGSGGGRLVSTGMSLEGRAGVGYALAAEFEDEEAVARFESDRKGEIRGIFSNPPIDVFPVADPSGAVGNASDVETKLGVAVLRAAGLDGHGVKLIIVDAGIDGSKVNVSGGFSPAPGVSPGTASPGHGTMVAFDALIAAPRAMIYDYPLLRSAGGPQWVPFLSDAIRVFSEILIAVLNAPGPMVIVNSWGMFARNVDAPVGDPQNYSANPRHPFNQLISAITGSGVDVVFAAGNCGAGRPDMKCGCGDTGPGNSIHGANSHPEVLTVGAATVLDEPLSYSSEGPGGLSAQKPDLSGFSHFSGSGIFPCDSGTSAACPVVAGAVAALRSKQGARSMPPAKLKSILMKTARDIGDPGWDPKSGWGMVDAAAAMALLPP